MSERLEESRRELEDSLADLRAALECEFGWAPKSARWALPLLAGAGGLALALWLRGGKRRRLPRGAKRLSPPDA